MNGEDKGEKKRGWWEERRPRGQTPKQQAWESCEVARERKNSHRRHEQRRGRVLAILPLATFLCLPRLQPPRSQGAQQQATR